MAWLDFLQAGLGAANAVSGFLGARKSSKPSDEERAALDIQNRATNRALALSNALTDPNDPTMKALEAEQQGKARDDLTAALNEIMVKNRRALQRGPVGVLQNQERRDETIARTLTQGYQNEQQRARERARQIIAGALSGNIGAASAGGGMAQGAFNRRLAGGALSTGANDILFRGLSQGADALKRTSLGAGAVSTDINDPTALGVGNRMFGRGSGGLLGSI